MVTAEAVGEKSELGGGGKSEGVTVPPVDLLTEVDEIVHSKHSFCRKCPLKKLKKKKMLWNTSNFNNGFRGFIEKEKA